MSARPVISLSVREFVEFACRTGSLGGRGKFVSSRRALEGTRGHQQIQKARPEGYESEVPVARSWEFPGFTLTLKGRIDGLMRDGETAWLEEIKTIVGAWDGVTDPLHWAQGKVYAALLMEEMDAAAIEVRLTYLELDSGHVTTFRETFGRAELRDFFETALRVQTEWLTAHTDWCASRDVSIRAVEFPHQSYRAGQRELAVAVYRALAQGRRLFAEAPTGIGKTISTLFPALKAIAEGHADQVLFVTAKTSGRAAAEKAVEDLRAAGMRLRSLTLTARDKICFGETKPCDATVCPFAIGFYDRVLMALRELLARETLGRGEVEEVARKHSVCPFVLSMAAVRWCDVVIGDYNHAFDPAVALEQFGEESSLRHLLLVDEAHNLVDRARKIFSAALDGESTTPVMTTLRKENPMVARALGKFHEAAKRLAASGTQPAQLPEEFIESLRKAIQRTEMLLARNEPSPGRELLLNWFFAARHFEATAADLSPDYALTADVGADADSWQIDLRCLDPSKQLRTISQQAQATVFFSATLAPQEYFVRLLGGEAEDGFLQLPSPFPPEHLAVLVETSVRTDFKSRDQTLAQVVEDIVALINQRTGNYLVFFPSYRYLEAVAAEFKEPALAGVRLLAQRPDMTDAEREAFLEMFQQQLDVTLVGLAVMGGVFGEGVDLVGDHLIGVVVVGVGLPQIGLERDLIRQRFDSEGGAGFDFAYRFPGLNRVIQAAGRVIRSETDRGVVLLLDARWREPAYAQRLPVHWNLRPVCGPSGIAAAAGEFWKTPAVIA